MSAIDGIEIIVLNRPFSERFGVEFALEFLQDISQERVDLIETQLPAYFGDASADNVVVKSVEDNMLVWVNKSLAYASCRDPAVRWMRDRLVTVKEGAAVPLPALLRHFSRYQLNDARVVLRGACAVTTASPEVTRDLNRDGFDGEGGGGDNIFHGLFPSSEYLLTFLVPAVIIVCMLLLALCLACLLHRKRRAGKLNLFYSEALPPRVPVILQDELYDDTGDAFRHRQMAAMAAGNGDNGLPEENRLLMMDKSDSLARPTPMYPRHH